MAKIYIACIASYNAGKLHGEWFDLDDYSDADDLREDIAEKVLRTSPCPNVMVVCPCCEGEGKVSAPVELEGASADVVSVCSRCNGKGEVPSAEEWAAHDYEDAIALPDMGEHPDLDELFEHLAMVEKHGEAWNAFVSYYGDSVTEQNFEDAYKGEYKSMEDFAQEFMEEIYGWKGDEPFYGWIDWERAARDLENDFTFEDGYVFSTQW